jgi:hypothetical protein
MRRMIHAFIALGFLCLSSCKEAPTPPPVKLTPPSLPSTAAIQVSLPVNAPAQVRDSYNEIYSSMNGVLRLYENIIKDNRSTRRYSLWTWTSVSPFGMITLEADALAGDSSVWKIYYNGLNLNNWISATGKVSLDSKFGAWQFYMPNSTVLNGSFNWLKNDRNVLTITATRFYDASPFDDLPSTYIDSKLSGQPDNSGSLAAFDQGVKIFEAIWDAAGAGWWAAYNSITGKQTAGGSWR